MIDCDASPTASSLRPLGLGDLQQLLELCLGGLGRVYTPSDGCGRGGQFKK